MMNSGSSSSNQPVDESDIDWESWINELKADDDFDFDFFVKYGEDTTTTYSNSQSQPIIPTINDGINLRGGSANQSPGGINQEIMTLSSFTPSNSLPALQISGPVLSAAAPKFVFNHIAQSCQSGRITDLPQYHPVPQNIPLHQQQVHSIMHQSNLLFGQQKKHLDSLMPSDQLHTHTRPMLDMETGNLSYHQESRQLGNANHNPSKIHLQAQQNIWTSHNLITGRRQQGNNPNTNLLAPVGFATPQEFPSSDAWREYAFRQIRKTKETYLNDLMKMHINSTCLCSQATNLEAANEYRKVKTYLERMMAFLNTSNVELIPKNDENVYNYMTLIVNYLHHFNFRNKHGGCGQNHEQFNQSPKPSQEDSQLESQMDIFNHIISSTRSYKPRGRMPISLNNSSFQMGIEQKSVNPPRMHSGPKINVVNVHQPAVANQKFSLEKMKQPMHITNERKKSRKPHGMSPLGSGLLNKCPFPHFSIPSSVKPISPPTTSQCSPLAVSSPRFDANHVLTPHWIARSPFILGPSPPEKQSTSDRSGSPTVESQELETSMDPPGTVKSQEPQDLEDQHHLMEVVESISSKAMGSSLTETHSVEEVIDSIPDYEAANILGPYEDNESNFILEGDNEPQQIKKCKFSVSSGFYDQFLFNEWGIDSTETSTSTRHETENNYGTILEEIKEINDKLVETSLHVLLGPCEDYISTTGGHSETKVKCVYKNVCVPELIGPPGVVYYEKTLEFFIQLLVPADYPASSPKISRSGINVLREPLRNLYDEMLSRFDLSFSELPGKMSLGDIAQKWESCARAVMLEYAHKKGGKYLSSRYGSWESCMNSSSGSS